MVVLEVDLKKKKSDTKLALKMYKDGYFVSEITSAVGISKSCFYLHLSEKVNNLIDLGKSIEEIKFETGCTEEYILKRINKIL